MNKKKIAGPERMCVICRQRFSKDELTRFVRGADNGKPIEDMQKKLPGRGFYLCGKKECHDKFPKFVSRRTKRKGEFDVE